jgi:2-polyprenyl-3-methyl-5-hydroxy-6-metoxy-1,4-benzoquinol methylase
MHEQSSLCDSDDYYDNDGKASRLRFGNGLILYLDRLKAKQVVKRTGFKSGRALDVGAGDGKYLYFLKRMGFDVRGTTASARARDAAKSRYGIDLALTTLLPEDIRQSKFDGVSYWHVFEHLENESDHTGTGMLW